MITRVGYIPYLNMVPFHQGFGPQPADLQGQYFEFVTMTPRVLGEEARKGNIDAGALSLVDALALADQFEPVGPFGIGLKRKALSVLLFSKKPIADIAGPIAVTDETSTSVKLLQVLLESRYGKAGLVMTTSPTPLVMDAASDAVLLIGDEALKARKQGIPGLPVVTDLGEEWFRWQATPFLFARWMVKKSVDRKVKAVIAQSIQNSLYANKTGTADQIAYWQGFQYKIRPEHERSAAKFASLLDKVCLTA